MSIVVKVMDKMRRASDANTKRRRAARRGSSGTFDADEAASEATGSVNPAEIDAQSPPIMEIEQDVAAPALQALADPTDRPSRAVRTTSGERKQVRDTSISAHGSATGPRAAAAAAVGTHAARTPRKLSLDVGRLEREGLIVPKALRERFVRQYRAIKRPLLHNLSSTSPMVLRNSNLILVTSAVPNEGKTFTAFNLTVSLAAEVDRTVLLVDADPARSRLSEALGLYDAPGLVDVLENRGITLADVLIRFDRYPNVRFLPSGAHHQNVTEYFASKRMQELVEEIARRYENRIVLFDSPPLLHTTEAVVLTGLAGQVLFVVKANETPQQAVKEALSKIDKEKAVGLVLNKCNVAGDSDYYASAYGY